MQQHSEIVLREEQKCQMNMMNSTTTRIKLKEFLKKSRTKLFNQDKIFSIAQEILQLFQYSNLEVNLSEIEQTILSCCHNQQLNLVQEYISNQAQDIIDNFQIEDPSQNLTQYIRLSAHSEQDIQKLERLGVFKINNENATRLRSKSKTHYDYADKYAAGYVQNYNNRIIININIDNTYLQDIFMQIICEQFNCEWKRDNNDNQLYVYGNQAQQINTFIQQNNLQIELQFPQNWQFMRPNELSKKVYLAPEDNRYLEIQRQIENAIDNITIQSVCMIQNKEQALRYHLKGIFLHQQKRSRKMWIGFKRYQSKPDLCSQNGIKALSIPKKGVNFSLNAKRALKYSYKCKFTDMQCVCQFLVHQGNQKEAQSWPSKPDYQHQSWKTKIANNTTIRVFDTDLIVPLYEVYFIRDESKKKRENRPKNRLISGGKVVPGEEDDVSLGSIYSNLNN